jgi:hypothetical protein
MRITNSRLGLVSVLGLAVAAILAAPQAAGAATAHSRAQPASHVQAVGRHPRLLASTDTQAVHPRISLPGCSGQDGYNGNVEWGMSSGSPAYFVKSWGEVWDLCGTQANLYLSYYVDGAHFNPDIASSGYDDTVGVNWSSGAAYNADPYSIYATVCAWWESTWRCGSPYYVPGS